jgi:DUF1365 family protein
MAFSPNHCPQNRAPATLDRARPRTPGRAARHFITLVIAIGCLDSAANYTARQPLLRTIFNPLSVYFCYQRNGSLAAILC